MKQSIRDKLEHLAARLAELDRELAAEDAARDVGAFRALGRERAEIEPVVQLYQAWRQTEADCATRLIDQVVVENGTSPLADIYFDLKEESLNRGEIDHDALIAGRPQVNGPHRRADPKLPGPYRQIQAPRGLRHRSPHKRARP